MADIAKPGRLAVTLLVEPRLGIGRAGMRLVRALLLVEIAFGIAARPLRIVVFPVLAAEALDRCPRLDQRPVQREMVARDQPFHLGLCQNRAQELRRDLSRK